MNYQEKAYGRQVELRAICKLFSNGDDVVMPGPRRLGKSFLLDRLVEAGPDQGWIMVKIEIAGARDVEHCMQMLCEGITKNKMRGDKLRLWLKQRLKQLTHASRAQSGVSLPQHLLTHDANLQFEMLLENLNKSQKRWALLIDELPIFLKTLHDSGPQGLVQARDFMNNINRLRQLHPKVRWLVTGSIGIEPLARAGQYLGALSKFKPFELQPLSSDQAQALVHDLAQDGKLLKRQSITKAEAQAIVQAVGWRSAYYVIHLTEQLEGEPVEGEEQAQAQVACAVQSLLKQANSAVFATWEEHLRKHYVDPERVWTFAVLNALAKAPSTSLTIDHLLVQLNDEQLTAERLRSLLKRMQQEGYVHSDNWEHENPQMVFHNPLLRRWWAMWQPSAQA